MNTLKKEFVPYEQAQELEILGYNESCFGWWAYPDDVRYDYPPFVNEDLNDDCFVAPTYSQAFRWFREKYELTSEVCVEQYRRKTNKKWMFSITYLNEDAMYEHSKTTFETYEEAELECLRKLIEIVKNKN